MSSNADHTLKREGKLILDESDSYGVEMALQLVDKAGGGEVTLVSMAPNGEVSGLRTALAMGAAKAILVSDDALHGADALDHRQGAGQVRRACRRRRPRAHRDRVDRRLHRHDPGAGRRAARLAVAHVHEARSSSATARPRCSARPRPGYDEVEAPLPAVVSVTAGVVEPRYPSFKGIMAAKSKPVDQVTAADLGLSADDVAPNQKIVSVEAAPAARPARRSRTTAPRTSASSQFLEQLKVI